MHDGLMPKPVWFALDAYESAAALPPPVKQSCAFWNLEALRSALFSPAHRSKQRQVTHRDHTPCRGLRNRQR